MSASGKHFEAFAEHTLLKHAILNAYLQRWAFKILTWRGAGDLVYFVDGFAGAGRDNQGNPGSPTIACRIAQQVRAHFAAKSASGRLKVLAVEADPVTHGALLKQLAAFQRVDAECVRALCGSVSERIGDIASEIAQKPTLFFLDPFGLKGLDAATYPAMLAGPHNEVLALYQDIGAARLRGVVHADTHTEKQRSALRSAPSLFPEMDVQAVKNLEAKAAKQRGVVQRLGPAAREAISRALGDSSWEAELRGCSAGDARIEMIIRFVRRLAASGAQYLHVLPMHSESGGHKYCLVHASKSLKGYIAMKEAVSESLNKTELSETMRQRMREDLRVPVSDILGFVQVHFGGQTVRWTGETSQEGASIRKSLLEDTSVFHFQCPEIKDELKSSGWLRRVNRVEVCSVPKR